MRILAETSGYFGALKPRLVQTSATCGRCWPSSRIWCRRGVPDDEPRSIWTVGFEASVPSWSIDLLLKDSTGHVWSVETGLGMNPEQLTYGEVGG